LEDVSIRIGYLQTYARFSDGRTAGTALFMNESEYNELKAIMARTDEMIRDLRQSGRMREMKFLA
jgi:hypothetical protein